MVLSDITNDYKLLIDTLNEYNVGKNYIGSARKMIALYRGKINAATNLYLKSTKREADKSVLVSSLNALEGAFAEQIEGMSSSLRRTTYLISEIERIAFVSESVKECAELLCDGLDSLMDITEAYVSNMINRESNTDTFFSMINELEKFENVYNEINFNYEMLVKVEEELLGELPFECTEEETFYSLDIRSNKPEFDVGSFSGDLKLLSDCLQSLERLVAPGTDRSIYLRKIESGSLKAVFGSDKVDFSIFPDIVKSFSDAMHTWRMTPCEKAKMTAETEKIQAETQKLQAETKAIEAQTEAQKVQNIGSWLAIADSQIGFVCEKLDLNPEDPGKRDEIQKLCLSVVRYLESNPVGSFNGVEYDVSKVTHLLEELKETD